MGKVKRPLENNIVEREVIRQVTFSVAGYMILAALHILWIIFTTSDSSILNQTPHQYISWGLGLSQLAVGVSLLVAKIRRNIHIINLSIGATWVSQFMLAAYTAIVYDFRLLTVFPSMGIGTISMVLWVYYRQRDHDHDSG